MTSSRVQPEPVELPMGPEVMVLGPPSVDRHARRNWIVVAAILAVVLVAYGAWRLWPQPPPEFTLADLEGTYTGMVRSDGTNELSTLTRDKLTEAPAAIEPSTCIPLFDQTLSNQFPASALDGVSTYWLDAGSASISLVTFRYTDPTAARAQFDQVQQAMDNCGGQPLIVDGNAGAQVAAQAQPAPQRADDYLTYLMSTPPNTSRFSTDVMLFTNTVTWQYRYDYHSEATYSPVAAQQLMASLASQMAFIQDSHRSRR